MDERSASDSLLVIQRYGPWGSGSSAGGGASPALTARQMPGISGQPQTVSRLSGKEKGRSSSTSPARSTALQASTLEISVTAEPKFDTPARTFDSIREPVMMILTGSIGPISSSSQDTAQIPSPS